MTLSPTQAWLVDVAADVSSADRFLAELGARLVAEGLPLAGGALTMAIPHPLVERRTWMWQAESGQVIEALGFVAGMPAVPDATHPPGDAGRRWLAEQAAGPAHEDTIERVPGAPWIGWTGPRPFTPDETLRLREVTRFAAGPLALLAARGTLTAALEAYLGRRSATRVLASPLRRGIGETIQAALLYADLRGFTSLSEAHPPAVVVASLDAWFDRMAGAIHAFGGEVLKFIGDGLLAIFPVSADPREACDAALRAVVAAQAGMAHFDRSHIQQELPRLRFGVALHLGEMLWGNIGTANRLDFTAIGSAVNLVSRLEGLCRPLGKDVLVSGAFADTCSAELKLLGTHALRGIASPCAVFTLPTD